MRLGLKLALSTICVVSILLGISGAVITSLNFQNSLDREEAAAKESYVTLLNNISVLKSSGVIEEISDVANLLSQYDSDSWSALELSIDGENLIQEDGNHLFSYFEPENSNAESTTNHSNAEQDAETDSENKQTSTAEPDTSRSITISLHEIYGGNYLKVMGSSIMGSSEIELNTIRDVGFLYESKDKSLHLFTIVFLIMISATAVASLISAYILTRPLSRLSKVTKEIATNNFASRSQVRTDDEIGDLSKDFDKMASEIEKNVNEMKLMLNRQKSFMGSFAHEMKTPMTSVIGYSDLIRQGLVDDSDKKLAAQYVFNEGKRLESLSSKLLELFLVEDGEIEMSPQDPSILIDDILSPLKSPLSKDSIELMWTLDSCSIEIDEALFRSLLINFVENSKRALSETNDPKIFVRGAVKQSYYEVSVTDNGQGIPKNDLGRITEEFYRVDKARSRRSGGAGLGLSLCQRIIRAHNGTLAIESSIGKGTCVRARFPISSFGEDGAS